MARLDSSHRHPERGMHDMQADTMMLLSEAQEQEKAQEQKKAQEKEKKKAQEEKDLLSKFVVDNNSDHEFFYKNIDILTEEIIHGRCPPVHAFSFDYAMGMLPRKVLSIVGPGGTALAKNLYDKNRGQFICTAQVHLSVESDMKTILGDMLRQITGHDDNHDALEETQLVERIKEALTFKRYLVVVLDIWEESEWTIIAGAFPMEYSGSSRVITTTRRNKVAEACCSSKFDLVYKLECPWPEDEAAKALVEMQREVADAPSGNCAWEDCALYLSTLPDHHEFERESLVGKWLAGKLVDDKEVANSYFDELVNRNVVLRHPHGQHYYRFGEEPTYEVCPTILAALRKMSEEKGFVTFMGNNGPASASSERRCVHLVYGSQPVAAEAAAATVDLRAATSVTARGHVQGAILPLKHLEKHMVLVLDLEGCKDVKDTDVVKICRHMTLLRYLSLKGTPVTVIPVDVHNLTSLETLDVRKTRLQQLPKEVALLPKLESLLFSGGVMFLGDMGAVYYYSSSYSSSSSIKVLGAVHQSELQPCLAYVQEVRDLVVVCNGKDLPGSRWSGGVSSFRPRSSTLENLEKLKVVGRWVKLPAWIKEKQLSKVTVLDIRMCQIDEGDLEALGRMALLESLALSLVSLPREQIAIRSHSLHDEPLFQRLEVFALDCPVPWVLFHDKAMPALQGLYLKLHASSGNLKTPSGTIHLASLREVTLHFSPRYDSSASVTHTIAAVEEELAYHTGNTVVTLFVNKEHKIPRIHQPGGIIALFPNWCMRNFLECVVMPTIYLVLCCYKRNGNFLFCMTAIAILVVLLPCLLSYYLLPNITNMVAHKIAERAFGSIAIVLPLPLVFYAVEGKSKWLPVLHFSLFILLDAWSYHPFTRAFPILSPVFLMFRYMYVQTGRFDWRLLVIIPVCTLLFCAHLHPSVTDIWRFLSSRVA